jgi:hypothetical protein
MLEYLMKFESQVKTQEGIRKVSRSFTTFINAAMLYKSIYARMWYDSPHIFKQFNRIGATLSQALVDANITTFQDLIKTGPRRLEAILKKNEPFGNHVVDTLEKLPVFSIKFEKLNGSHGQNVCIEVKCVLENYETLLACGEDGGTLPPNHQLLFILGDVKDKLLYYQKMRYFLSIFTVNGLNKDFISKNKHSSIRTFLTSNGRWSKRIKLSQIENGSVLFASIISTNFGWLIV